MLLHGLGFENINCDISVLFSVVPLGAALMMYEPFPTCLCSFANSSVCSTANFFYIFLSLNNKCELMGIWLTFWYCCNNFLLLFIYFAYKCNTCWLWPFRNSRYTPWLIKNHSINLLTPRKGINSEVYINYRFSFPIYSFTS